MHTGHQGGGDTLPPLPSLFAPVMLREGGDAMARAVELAPEGASPIASGAGTLVWVRALNRAEAAVVLEPDRPLGPARLAYLAAANALADTLSAIAPPELPVTWRWPGTLAVNGGVVGQMRLALPEGATEDAIPDWMVVGFELRLAWPESVTPGERPGETSLQEEGFEDLTPAGLTEAWARHLMANMDEWNARGPRRVAEKYLARLEEAAGEKGVKRGIDPNTGALVIHREGGRETWPIS
ncbi:biotin/lipoate--protein ligase family protein [Sediminicoccus rosea]|uniref:Biotin/lipoate--protein ligase family protein n=1 Tax=Sediminicoccus rosea TaxID=1225128 RepID=A0ABZ0PJB5_9PROT|nr:biotin/lipoate--protein ligase family protein [Sediminicoccus rosea]WPB85567.1 biotin/lipoate--protein ligase family protein [Sediminicoccus rosea]